MSLDDNTLDWVLNKINAYISKCNKGLEEVEDLAKNEKDLNLQAVEDVVIVLTLKRDAMVELKRDIERTS